MTTTKGLRSLQELLGKARGSQLLLITKDRERNLQAYSIETDVAAAEALRTACLSFVERQMQKECVGYEPGMKMSGQYLIEFGLTSHSTLSKLLADCKETTGILDFDNTEKSLAKVSVYAVVVSNGKDTALLLQRPPRGPRVGETHTLVQSGKYSLVKGLTLQFTTNFGAVIWDSKAYFTNSYFLDLLLPPSSQKRSLIRKATDDICKIIPISNRNDFEEACKSDFILANAVLNIVLSGRLEKITRSALEAHLDNVTEEMDWLDRDTWSITFNNDSNSRWKIIHLLDADYYTSDLTGEHLVAHTKTTQRGGE